MSPKIAVLPDQVADQIAAGEVVERPASVVKELVENALDAGARTVRVAIENGGKTLIRVSDDGEGMSRADAELALARHATSKIRSAADLIGVATFGFRGEALPAVASVSRFELETSPDGRTGTRLRVVGARLEAVDDAVRQRGTTVTVQALFFNTPARRKFLRAQATETRAALDALTMLALTRPDVAFTLSSDERALLDVAPAAEPIDRVAGLWGREFADTLVPVAHREGPLELTGFAQRPAQAKPAGRKGYVFVHRRPIRDPFILRAGEAGYRSTIAPGDRPSLLLFLELPGDAVDVNVHPAKLEVRFRDKFFVERVVEEGVRRALAPLGAAAPLQGVGVQTAGVGFQVPGVSGSGSALEIFPGEPLTPDTQHLTPFCMPSARLSQLGEVLSLAVRAPSVREPDSRMLEHVLIQPPPVPLGIANLLAVQADRQEALEQPDLARVARGAAHQIGDEQEDAHLDCAVNQLRRDPWRPEHEGEIEQPHGGQQDREHDAEGRPDEPRRQSDGHDEERREPHEGRACVVSREDQGGEGHHEHRDASSARAALIRPTGFPRIQRSQERAARDASAQLNPTNQRSNGPVHRVRPSPSCSRATAVCAAVQPYMPRTARREWRQRIVVLPRQIP